jgi:hypothetical protein
MITENPAASQCVQMFLRVFFAQSHYDGTFSSRERMERDVLMNLESPVIRN